MSDLVNQIVEELLNRHVGVVTFFDHLDATWRSPRGWPVVQELLARALVVPRSLCAFARSLCAFARSTGSNIGSPNPIIAFGASALRVSNRKVRRLATEGSTLTA